MVSPNQTEPTPKPPMQSIGRSIGRHIINKLDTARYFRLANGLGSQLNDRKSRFDKSDIIEQCLEVYSDGSLKWVDEIGHDMVDAETGAKIEVKYEDHGVTTRAGNRKSHVSFKIKNTLKTLTTPCLADPADYYLFLDLRTIAGISYKDMEPYLHITKSGDGIACRIPANKVEILAELADTPAPSPEVNYKKEKHMLQRRIIDMM
jgi:hypothetical protein